MITIEQVAEALIEFSYEVSTSFDFMYGAMEKLYTQVETQYLLQAEIIVKLTEMDNSIFYLTLSNTVNATVLICILIYLLFSNRKKKTKKRKK